MRARHRRKLFVVVGYSLLQSEILIIELPKHLCAQLWRDQSRLMAMLTKTPGPIMGTPTSFYPNAE
jgi:hypothetical protein